MRRIRSKMVAVVVFGFAVLPSPAVHATIATFCPSPGSVASDWQQEVPNAECLTGEGTKVCKAWVATCKKLVRETAKCQVTQGKMTAKLEKARCKLGTVGDQKQCKQDASAAFKGAKARVKIGRDNAIANCVAYLNTCVAICEN